MRGVVTGHATLPDDPLVLGETAIGDLREIALKITDNSDNLYRLGKNIYRLGKIGKTKHLEETT